MDNLENLRMWVNRQLSQKQKKINDYKKFFIEENNDFSDMNTQNVIKCYNTFLSDFMTLTDDEAEIQALKRIENVFISAEGSEEVLLMGLIYERDSFIMGTNLFLETVDLDFNSELLVNSELPVGYDFKNKTSIMQDSIKCIEIFTKAINILEGKTEE